MEPFLLVGLGGAAGSVARYLLSRLPAVKGLPAGTLAVNVSGSFLIAVLAGLGVSPDLHYLLAIGVLGGYTTFSTFGFETFRLLEDGDGRAAALNVGLNVLGSLLAAGAGFMLTGVK